MSDSIWVVEMRQSENGEWKKWEAWFEEGDAISDAAAQQKLFPKAEWRITEFVRREEQPTRKCDVCDQPFTKEKPGVHPAGLPLRVCSQDCLDTYVASK
jgi:hypothetical protein